MIKQLHAEYIQHLREEYWESVSTWPATPSKDRRSWTKYLSNTHGIVIQNDSMRGYWIDFKSDKTEAEFNSHAEQHQTWKALVR